ncbi:MAG: hypothetical protein RL326_481 [Pseudomonadota bacterium]
MDALEELNRMSGLMTAEQWAAFKESDDGLWLRARVEGFKGTSMSKLIEAGKRRRAEAWEIARDMARNIVHAEVQELKLDVTDEQRGVLVEKLAEKLCCEQSIIPPRFSKLVTCSTCGPVHAPEDTDDTTPNCPWCTL